MFRTLCNSVQADVLLISYHTKSRLHTYLQGICFLLFTVYIYVLFNLCSLFNPPNPHPRERVWVPLCLRIANLCLSLPTT